MRWAWIALLVGCAGASTSSSSSSTSTSTEGSDETAETPSGTTEAATEPERVNLSAGAPSASPALVPQRGQSDFIDQMHIVRERPFVITGTSLSAATVTVVS